MEAQGNTDRLLLESFAAGRLTGEPGDEEGSAEMLRARAESGIDGALVEARETEAFVAVASECLSRSRQSEILRRAVGLFVSASGESPEGSFISLYAALESVLTFFRHEDEYEILPPEDFSRLERDLKGWLKEHPLLAADASRRALIYEKIRELNRFPFSHVFRKFCRQYEVDLSDLWPVLGRPEEWPLAEIRHRLIHGDPFASRPAESLVCAREHLRWTVARMLLTVLGWPVSRSRAGSEYLSARAGGRRDWRAERARFA
ncbi:MAG TPA: hypothetical protein VNA19_06240 [Pyrinomonadaceae bacterium]|jgi:hypothetical protein|nr:hypothetical protein [Pyrinomonadaceae bacterium]